MLPIKAYALSTLWLLVATQGLIWHLIICVPFMLGGFTPYRRVCSLYNWLIQPGFLAVPFSWAGNKVWCHAEHWLETLSHPGSTILMCNHSGRIDPLIGALFAMALGKRIGYVSEITHIILPVFGWGRVLYEDIFLRRTFHRDRPRIGANIAAFKASKVERLMMICPEGAITDPGCAKDAVYIKNCAAFMQKGTPLLPPERSNCRR